MASQSNNSSGNQGEQDPLLEALESIKHLLDQSELPGGGAGASKAGQAAAKSGASRAQPASKPAAKPAQRRGSGAPARPAPTPASSGELDLPVLEEVVLPGQIGENADPAALTKALRQLQDELSRSIDQTLQQAATQISARLKQELRQRIDAIIKGLE